MKNAAHMISLSVSFILFMAVLSNSHDAVTARKLLLDEADRVLEERDPNLAPRLQIPATYTVTGATVLQSIYHIRAIGAVIQVGMTEFGRDVGRDRIDASGIRLYGLYHMREVWHPDGSLEKVIFNPL
ncbi:enoyl-CoA hydratase [Paenibacillus thiaminolyticus]|uniref:Enoyl-CoA hydratase n=1 Tax=Paenibacillus thiaminolyticus TaxID=49283 RepID=A0A3A3H578_PANTH|nr:enoyl-CoA hydratase [Paenibacillus thiaminolyticus]RJG24630.1 enoyl-CoA hydratase [Paenibacillus thiaminolyticus]